MFICLFYHFDTKELKSLIFLKNSKVSTLLCRSFWLRENSRKLLEDHLKWRNISTNCRITKPEIRCVADAETKKKKKQEEKRLQKFLPSPEKKELYRVESFHTHLTLAQHLGRSTKKEKKT